MRLDPTVIKQQIDNFLCNIQNFRRRNLIGRYGRRRADLVEFCAS